MLAAAPAPAQTYAPGYAVCLHVYGPVSYYECSYTSLPQCNAFGFGPRVAVRGQSLNREPRHCLSGRSPPSPVLPGLLIRP